MKKNQQGMTFWGVTFVGMAIVFGAILMMKLIPPYLEFWSVEKVIGVMAKDPALPGMTQQEVRTSFSRRSSIDNIKVIEGKDLEISKEHGQTVVSANYTVLVPIVGNLSAFLEFKSSTQDSKNR
ncbi:MAG: DUF4845 domain-containing protein [Sulfuricella denitrificans]|nr:DUF4845 domain-containing protein [Sulfuricella denitrificans]